MLSRLAIISTYLLFLFPFFLVAQGGFRLPSLNEARLGHTKAFKIPTLKDYNSFIGDYKRHLSLLDRRSEKAYRKSFLKFIAIEDRLLYTLCDSNEFRANMLMRSASASFGKMEHDRNRLTPSKQQKHSHQKNMLREAVAASTNQVAGINALGLNEKEKKHTASQVRYGSNLYASYMRKRVRMYKTTFKDGDREQKRLYRKLRKRAALWQSYKSSDQNLIAKFANGHTGVMRGLKGTESYKRGMASHMPNYPALGTESSQGAKVDRSALLDQFKQTFLDNGTLDTRQLDGIEGITELFQKAKEARAALPDSLKPEAAEEPVKINKSSTQSFWDRLYGGADFDWENSTGYYPDGLGITATGGYKISGDCGLNLELNTILNAGQMGFRDDRRFESTLVSNYSIGANIDHRIWKVFFAGIGAEAIINTIEAPAGELLYELQNPAYGVGIPLIVKALIPIGGSKSTSVAFTYDLNSKNNIKPQFDLSVGFLIGRK